MIVGLFTGLLSVGGIERVGRHAAAIRAGIPSGVSGREKLTYLETPSDENTYLLFRGLFAPRQIQNLLGIGEKEFDSTTQSLNLHPIFTQSPNLLQSFVFFEFNHYLQNQLLKDTDVMSMAHSVETRVPFLDHRLVEYVAGVPAGLKLGNGMNKSLLVKAMGEDLPSEIWDRPKMGFTFPFGEWMRERSDELKAGCLETKMLDRKAVEAAWKGFGEGRAHWSRPWAMVVASHFHQTV